MKESTVMKSKKRECEELLQVLVEPNVPTRRERNGNERMFCLFVINSINPTRDIWDSIPSFS